MPRKRKKKSRQQPSAPLISEGKKEQYFFLPLTLLLAAVAYALTICPTIFVGDSGELTAAAYFLGIPHSPGYPLYCLLGWVFSHLPIANDIAFRMNIMSAFFALGTVFILYLIIYHFTRTPYLSFSISLAYAFSPIFWSQAVVAEVYSLNTFLTALSLYFLCRWVEKRDDRWLYFAFTTMGLAVANHQLSFLLLPTALYMLWLFWKDVKKPVRFWITLGVLYVLGFFIYLYLPIRAAANPPLNWGDPDTPLKFLQAIFRPAGAQTARGSVLEHIAHAFYLWTVQFSPFLWVSETKIPIPIIWLFGIWGIYKGISTKWRMARVFAFFMLLNLAVILFVSRPSRQELLIVGVYYLPVFMVFAVFMATGLREWIIQYLNAFRSPRRPILYGLVILIIVLIPEYQFIQNRPDADRSRDYYARDYATNLLESCPLNSILLVNWDDIFTIWYLQDIENLRKDIIPVLAELPTQPGSNYWGEWYFEELLEKHPEIFDGSGFESKMFLTTEDAVNAFVQANLDRGREVYFSFYGVSLNFELFTFYVHPLGGVYRCSNEQYSITDLIIAQQAWRVALDDFRNIYNYNDYRIEEEDFIISRISDNLFYTAQLAINLGDRPKAIWFFQQSVKINNLNLNAIVPLAEIYLEDGNYPEARDLLLQARDLDPGNPDIHILLARLHLAISQIELARQSLETVISLDPSNPEARALLERIGPGD
ncbi:MAG: DUF2723 domain-containing protein [bacterium]|nr:DUF2723 domain-containing protein [bacterium]